MATTQIIPVLSKTPNLLRELVKIIPSVNFHEVIDPETDVPFKKSEVLICDFNLLGKYLYDLPHAKWVQGTWAGIDKLLPFVQSSKPVTYQITRFTGEHFGRLMGEYVLAHIINLERGFFQSKKFQCNSQWNAEGKISDYRSISDLTIGILGVGSIGNKIGQLLHLLGGKILAFGRRSSLPPDDNNYSHISKYFTKETLPELLKESDYIVCIMPKTKETNDLLENDILQNCTAKQSVFINIGRSNIVSEQTIVKAVQNKWLSSVVLDVFDIEPLPQESPLWKMEQVIITPHVAGVSRAKDIAQQFSSNFYLYKNNLPLPAIIDFTKSY